MTHGLWKTRNTGVAAKQLEPEIRARAWLESARTHEVRHLKTLKWTHAAADDDGGKTCADGNRVKKLVNVMYWTGVGVAQNLLLYGITEHERDADKRKIFYKNILEIALSNSLSDGRRRRHHHCAWCSAHIRAIFLFCFVWSVWWDARIGLVRFSDGELVWACARERHTSKAVWMGRLVKHVERLSTLMVANEKKTHRCDAFRVIAQPICGRFGDFYCVKLTPRETRLVNRCTRKMMIIMMIVPIGYYNFNRNFHSKRSQDSQVTNEQKKVKNKK